MERQAGRFLHEFLWEDQSRLSDMATKGSSSSSRSAAKRRAAPTPRAKAARDVLPSPAANLRTAHVVLDLDVSRDRVHLVIANCGDGVATDVRVQFSRAIKRPDEAGSLGDLPIFKRLGVLRPGREVYVFWNTMRALAVTEECKPFNATVSWSDPSGDAQSATYRHDPSIGRDWPRCIEA